MVMAVDTGALVNTWKALSAHSAGGRAAPAPSLPKPELT